MTPLQPFITEPSISYGPFGRTGKVRVTYCDGVTTYWGIGATKEEALAIVERNAQRNDTKEYGIEIQVEAIGKEAS